MIRRSSGTRVAIFGIGRVGLPLALTFAEAGLEVLGVDTNASTVAAVNARRRMPFREPGFDELMRAGKVRATTDYREARGSDFYVITVGTPLMHHIETDLSNVSRVACSIAEMIEPGQTVVLRSTTAPGTTAYVKHLLESKTGLAVGAEIGLACCPERITEGHAREELRSLPQVVGANDELSRQMAAMLFGKLGSELLPCDWATSELVKLFNNVSRYAYFAIVNVLSMIAMDHGAEPLEVLKLANYGYPRPIFGKPGFTAGTCLRKDFGMLSEGHWSGDILVEAWRINESLPRYLVEQARKRFGSMRGKKVAVLGYSFKRDTDDVRDSLAAKLIRYIHRECVASIVVADPFVAAKDVEPISDLTFTADHEQAMAEAEVVFMATNHSAYENDREQILEHVVRRNVKVIDIWNVLGTGRVLVDQQILEKATCLGSS